ncbi:MAG: flavodoxin domain-containing protein, partial [Proteobacteria bacterium]|nr:flavodoxin domain-containing protein [Pseudomonadota bacterium]
MRRNFLSQTRNMLNCIFLFNLFPLLNSRLYAEKVTPESIKKPRKILIIFASYHGSTAQIAKYIGKRLESAGIQNETKSITEDINFYHYSSIIMGAPIHRGKWMKAATLFVTANFNSFMDIPFACFFTCMAEAKQPKTKETIKDIKSYQKAVLELFPGLRPFD